MFTTFRILLFAKWLVNGVISNVFKRQFSTNLLYLLYVLMDIVFLHSPGNCQCLKWNFFCLLYFPLAKCLYCIGSNSKLCLTACIKIAIFDKYQNSFALWTSDSFRAYTWTSKVLLRLSLVLAKSTSQPKLNVCLWCTLMSESFSQHGSY